MAIDPTRFASSSPPPVIPLNPRDRDQSQVTGNKISCTHEHSSMTFCGFGPSISARSLPAAKRAVPTHFWFAIQSGDRAMATTKQIAIRGKTLIDGNGGLNRRSDRFA